MISNQNNATWNSVAKIQGELTLTSSSTTSITVVEDITGIDTVYILNIENTSDYLPVAGVVTGTVGSQVFTFDSPLLSDPTAASDETKWTVTQLSISERPPELTLTDSTTTSLNIVEEVLTEDPLLLYSSLDGMVQRTAGTVTLVNGNLFSGFPCEFTYFNKYHKHNILQETTVSNITGWTTGTSLPGALAYSQAVVTKNRVYLLGGYNSASVSTVYTAPINEDGTLGTWTTGTSLPGALANSQAVVTKNRVYLLGGSNVSVHVSTVYTAPFADGWEITTNSYDTGTNYYLVPIDLMLGAPIKAFSDANTTYSLSVTNTVGDADVFNSLSTTKTYNIGNDNFDVQGSETPVSGRILKLKIESERAGTTVNIDSAQISLSKEG